MIKKVNEINSCLSLSLEVIGGNIIYVKDDVYYLNDVAFIDYEDSVRFSSFQNHLYFCKNSTLFKIIDNSTYKEICHFEGFHLLSAVANNMLFSRKIISRRESQYAVYDFNCNLLWSHTGTESIIRFKRFVKYSTRFNQTDFEARDIKSGETLWKYMTEDEFKIPINVGGNFNVVDDIFVISQVKEANPIDEVLTVGLNMHTGEKFWQVKGGSHYHILNPANNLLYAFTSNIVGDNFLIELNPVTGEYKETHFNDFKGSTKPHLCAIHKNKLYFSNNKAGCGLGVIDLDTKELVEQYDFNFKEVIKIYAPQIGNNKIYVLDTLNTIHVLEHSQNTLEA